MGFRPTYGDGWHSSWAELALRTQLRIDIGETTNQISVHSLHSPKRKKNPMCPVLCLAELQYAIKRFKYESCFLVRKLKA
jgi:hypothetical protein